MQLDSGLDTRSPAIADRDATSQTSMPSATESPADKSHIQALHKKLQSALEEIGMLKQRALAESQSQASLSGLDTEPGTSGDNVWRPAWDGFRRGFVLAYAVRAGLGTMTRALALARAGQYKDMRGWRLISESGLHYREDAVRLGLFIGGFTGSYHLISGSLKKWQGSLPPAQNCMAAGTAAGLTLMFLSKERRRTLALYTLARIAQCLYNSLKQQGLFHFWGSDWAYGDALLFALSSAQVMYAYVMRPETLPKSYWKFIVKSGPIETPALEAVRRSIRKLPIDLQSFNAFIKKRGGTAFLTTAFPAQITDAMLHPQTASALVHSVKVPWDTFRKTFPLYISISLVPYVVLNLKRALRNPVGTAGHAVGSAVRSTSFLAAFVGIYSAAISLHRKLFTWDHKLLYYVAGLAASGSILIEKKSRRSELALYVMPRAVDAFVLALTKKRWVPSVKFGEVILFSLCMGGLMYYRQHEPETMAPLLNTLISRVVFGETKKRRPDLPRPASIAFSEGDFPGSLYPYSTQPSSQGNSPSKGLASLGSSPDKGTMAQPQADLSALGNSHAQQQVSGRGNLVQPGGNSHGGSVTSQGDRGPSNGEQPLQAACGPDQQSEGQTSTASHSLHAQEGSQDCGADENSLSQSQINIAHDSTSKTSTSAVQQDANGQADAHEQTDERSHGDFNSGEKQSEAESHETSNSVVDAAVPEGPNRDDLVNLVQGTEQFIGMLQARDVS
ncbi:MAG: hypothetical protein FRX49_11574 [Trebouxia sp. A1-2]|nr:MAG: hypothetical protein FRX49_11574 [Trebouxia sp. A1-2]